MNSNLNLLGFELAYLATLTKFGLKPLSRWEAGITEIQLNILLEYGLKVRRIRRLARSKLELFETVFSNSEDCINLYARIFNNRPLNSTPFTIRAEGSLFGYPCCCVESFIKNGYRENGLDKRDQGILFHWACSNCPATRILIPEYRRIYDECLGIFDIKRTDPVLVSAENRNYNNRISRNSRYSFTRRRFKRLNSLVHIIAPLFLVWGLNAQSDPHLPPVNQYEDSDRDFLTDTEESIIGSNPLNPDEDGNKCLDGIDLAKTLYDLIMKLPDTPSSNRVYGIPHMAFGLETCNVCGELVNMGFLQIVNPLENFEINLPFIAIHYLEHGAFVYSGSIHSGKLKPAVLKTALESDGLAHFISETSELDEDNDSLLNYEEKIFGCLADDPDSNLNGIRDGIEVARTLLQRLKSLPRATDINSGPKDRPFVVEHPMDGYEICPRCGESIVMDWWLVYNPKNNLQISIPSMALHYMEHGGFRWEGGQMYGGAGRVSAKQLSAVLDSTEDGHIVPATGDSDEDGIEDNEEAVFLLSPQNPDTTGNGIKDGCDMAKVYYQLISKLPRAETNGTYVIEHPMRGFVYCPICADTINMGYIEIVNKERKINRQISYLKLHFLEHGSFVMPSGEYISLLELSELFKPNITISASLSGIKFRWKGESGKNYGVLVSESLTGPWTVYGIYEGADKEIEINDQSREDRKFYRILIY